MPSEPEKNIERLLNEHAQKRRDDAGAPMAMHPATRKLLQGEVTRIYGKTAEEPRAQSTLWAALWRRVALAGCFAALLMLVSTVWVENHRLPGRHAMMVSDQPQSMAAPSAPAAAAPVLNPEPQLKEAEAARSSTLTVVAAEKPRKEVVQLKSLRDNERAPANYASGVDAEAKQKMQPEADLKARQLNEATREQKREAQVADLSKAEPESLNRRFDVATKAKRPEGSMEPASPAALPPPPPAPVAPASTPMERTKVARANTEVDSDAVAVSGKLKAAASKNQQDEMKRGLLVSDTKSMSSDKLNKDVVKELGEVESRSKPTTATAVARPLPSQPMEKRARAVVQSGEAAGAKPVAEDRFQALDRSGGVVKSDEAAKRLAPAPLPTKPVSAGKAVTTELAAIAGTNDKVLMGRELNTRSAFQNGQQYVQMNTAGLRRNLNSPPMPPVLKSFQVEQSGSRITIVDGDGSVYAGDITYLVSDTTVANVNLADAAEAKSLDSVALGLRQEKLAESSLKKSKEEKAADSATVSGVVVTNGVAFYRNSAQSLYFRVSGTNRTLNQLVVFDGALVNNTNTVLDGTTLAGTNTYYFALDGVAQQTGAGSGGARKSAAQNDSYGLMGGRIDRGTNVNAPISNFSAFGSVQTLNGTQNSPQNFFIIRGRATIGEKNDLQINAVPVAK